MIERKENTTLGTIYYPISMAIMALLSILNYQFLPCYGIGLFCLSLGDGFAPYFAYKFPSPKILKSNKTITGTITVFIISLLVILSFQYLLSLSFTTLDILILASISSILEYLGRKGTDNLLLPIGVSLLSYLLL